jgi:hypothetical protein
MKDPTRPFDKRSFMSQLEHSGVDLSELPGNMFQRFSVYFDRPDTDLDMGFAVELVKLGGGTVVSSADNIITTHVVVGRDAARLSEVRSAVSRQHPIPRIVDVNWVLGSWREKTILGEERKYRSVECLVAKALRVSAHVVLNNDMTTNVDPLPVCDYASPDGAQSRLNMLLSAFSSSFRTQRNLHHRMRVPPSSPSHGSAVHSTPQTLPKTRASGTGP